MRKAARVQDRSIDDLGHAVTADAASSASTLHCELSAALSSAKAICPRVQNNLILTDIIAKLGLLDYYE